MPRPKQREEQTLQESGEQQTDHFPMQQTAGFGSDFGANHTVIDEFERPSTAAVIDIRQ
jgi:hypothetical protein